MGLDMYLDRHHYYGGQWKDDNHKDEKCHHTLKLSGVFAKERNLNANKVNEIVENVAYWRKANEIHNWFVSNVQDGVDDCKRYYLSVETLKTLLGLCYDVKECLEKEDYDKAEELLPTCDGFFFGDYGVEDEWYSENIQHTIKSLERIIKTQKEGMWDSFYYCSSW